MTGAHMILSTAPTEAVAASIARTLVEERLVACVNLVPHVRSIYRWEGAVTDETEVLLVLKTTGEQLAAVKVRLKELHPYAVPEFVVLAVTQGSEAYLRWLGASVGHSSP